MFADSLAGPIDQEYDHDQEREKASASLAG